MPFTPAYELLLSEKLQDNLLAIIDANETDALTFVNNNVALPAFKMKDRARRVTAQYPYLMVGLNRSNPNEQEDHFAPQHEFIIEIAIQGSDPNLLAVQIQRYVRAVTLMILSATPQQVFGGYDVQSPHRWTVGAAQYGAFQSKISQSQYLHLAQFPVRVEAFER